MTCHAKIIISHDSVVQILRPNSYDYNLVWFLSLQSGKTSCDQSFEVQLPVVAVLFYLELVAVQLPFK